jgi:hypothetical protein
MLHLVSVAVETRAETGERFELAKKSPALALLNLVEPCWSLVRSPLQNHLRFWTIYSELFGPLAYVR